MPGIGKRTAERIIVELREKVAGELEEAIADRRAAEGGDARARWPARACVNLGYTPLEAEQLLDGARGRERRGADRRGAAQRPRERREAA